MINAVIILKINGSCAAKVQKFSDFCNFMGFIFHNFESKPLLEPAPLRPNLLNKVKRYIFLIKIQFFLFKFTIFAQNIYYCKSS